MHVERLLGYGLLVLCTVFPAVGGAADLTVMLVGLRSTAGVVRLSLYNRAETFLDDSGRLARQKALVTSTSLQVTFTGLDPGTYALSVVHDENDDGKLNRNLLGIPLEGYGFSNDAPSTLGPPSFAQAAVPLRQKHTSITISMRYYKRSSAGGDQKPVTTPRQ